MASNYTENYGLCQWEAADQVLREEFNEGHTKIDAALKAQADDLAAEVSARKEGDSVSAASNCLVKLLEKTLEVETQKWDIDMSGIDLTKYQKLQIYPHLTSNCNQIAELHINKSEGRCGSVPSSNIPGGTNFGICEFTFLTELPHVYVVQLGVVSHSNSSVPYLESDHATQLDDGVTHLDSFGIWFRNASDRILRGSSIQIYGIKR